MTQLIRPLPFDPFSLHRLSELSPTSCTPFYFFGRGCDALNWWEHIDLTRCVVLVYVEGVKTTE